MIFTFIVDTVFFFTSKQEGGGSMSSDKIDMFLTVTILMQYELT